MAYTNTWTTTVPTGAEALSTADNEIRKLRLDIQERMTSLGIDFTADPVAITKYHYMAWSDFFIQTSGGTLTFGAPNYGITDATTAITLYAPVILPRGAVVTSMVLSGGTGAGSTSTCALMYTDTTTGTPAETTVSTISLGSGTAQTETTSTFSHTIDNTASNFRYYGIKIVLTPGGGTTAFFQGVRLKYSAALTTSV